MLPIETEDGHEREISRRTLLLNGALVAGSLSLGGVGTANANDDPQTWTRQPRFSVYSPCTDEVVDVVGGTQHYLLHTHIDGNGGQHINYQTYWDPMLTVVGRDTGFTWTGMNTKNWSDYIRPPYPWTGTFMSTSTATSEDTNIVVMLRLRTQLTINAKGDMTNFHQQYEIRCKGSDVD